jgi:hypothetical protein
MSATAVITRTETIAEMVQKITNRRVMQEESDRKHDELLTEIIIPAPKGKHRAEPAAAAAFLSRIREPKHRSTAPTSLAELLK